MEEIVLGFLGPYTSLIVGSALAAAVFWRKSIRKRHIVILLVVAIVALIAFFGVLLWSFGRYKGQKSLVLVHAALSLLAAVFVGSSAAIGFSFILKSLGLAPLADAEGDAEHPPRLDGRERRESTGARELGK